jgi:protein NrfD
MEEQFVNTIRELVVTRHNEMIDPAIRVWGWEIGIYLFLGGMVAGMMVILGYFLFKGRHRELRCSCTMLPGFSIVLLSLGMLALFLDLEHRWHFWRMYVTFRPASPMSWGSWILVLVYPVLLTSMIIRLPDLFKSVFPSLGKLSEKAQANPTLIKFIGISNMVLGAMLGIYTGILLSAFGARPLWNSSLLGPLFLVSGLSTAAAFVHLIARDPYERVLLAKADNGFLGVELFLITLFLLGLLSSTQVHIESAQMLLIGPFAPIFLVFVVGLGIVIPLFIQSLAVSHRIRHTPAAPIMVIAGGLVLRLVIVYAGQASHWARMSLHG